MDVTLPLDQMTVAEKLRVLETVWDDLCRNQANVPSPNWHGDVLAVRERRLATGSERTANWEEAKRRIRGSVE